MSAAVLTRAQAVREAHALLHVAMELPAPQHPEAEAAIAALGKALHACAELDSGALGWEWDYPELAGEADPGDLALRKAAAESAAAAEDLIRVMAAHCGTGDETKNAAAGVTA